MPELWLNYGSTDIIVDLKVENLSLIENSKFDTLPPESLRQKIESIEINDNTVLIPLDASNSTVQLTSSLVSFAETKGVKISIESVPKIRKQLTSKIQNQNIALLERKSDHFLERTSNKHTIFISKTNIDPFFGYGGTPTKLLREFGEDEMNKAFNSRVDDLPHPASKGPPLEIAEKFCQDIGAMSIEIVSNNSGINNFFYGELADSFHSGIEKLHDLSIETELGQKSLIIGTNIDTNSSSTLSSSLDLLWNSIHLLRKNSIVVIVSENNKGFGTSAIEKFAYRQSQLDDYKNSNYIDGLEHLMFINELKEKYTISVLSSLPKYYLKETFGFRIFTNIQEAADKILELNGKSHKISIALDPNVAIFKNELTR
jgi:hypothetical protein